MPNEDTTLRGRFREAESQQRVLESAPSSNSADFQEKLASTISKFEDCLRIATEVSLFSANETIEDVSSGDLQYFTVHYRIAELVLRINDDNRKALLYRSRKEYENYLKLLDSYDILSRNDARIHERYLENPNSFSVASTTDAAARRQTKIARFKEEKLMKTKLDELRRNPKALQNDDAALRDLQQTNISFCTHIAFQSLESIAQELDILSMAPSPSQPTTVSQSADERVRERPNDGYSERLDGSLSHLLAGRGGPILNKDGRPLRPFTLLDTRQRLQQGVFRPDHNLPTMTIDEYLEEERRRGGIIEGGGAQSAMRPEIDEDDLSRADEENIKARHWDDFKEDNPKGSGNTMNMG